MASVVFRSPLRKLVEFFKSSRDKWKEKCQQAKYELKLLKRRFGNLQKNCDKLKHRNEECEGLCEQLQAQNEHLRVQQQILQAQVDSRSKKGATSSWLASTSSQ
jgi:predicted RNase H-like nuclease (RuvC/YqgF family)